MYRSIRSIAAALALCACGSAAAACEYGDVYGQENIGSTAGTATILVALTSGAFSDCTPALTTAASWFSIQGSSVIDTDKVQLVSHGYELRVAVQQNNGSARSAPYEVAGSAFVMHQAGRLIPDYRALAKEYYYADWDYYFLTADAGEQALLGKPPFEQWQATGRTFFVYQPNTAMPASPGTAVCRFFNVSFTPKSTHFYALPDVCELVITLYPDWQLEARDAFNMGVPNIDGSCPAATPVPVYRLYNNGQGGAPNHRFVTSLGDRAGMIDDGWVPEGAGALGVGFCAPSGG